MARMVGDGVASVRPCFGDQGTSYCPSGGPHDRTGSDDYVLFQFRGEDAWNCCRNCRVLFNCLSSGRACPMGGQHNGTSSANYIIPSSKDEPSAQPDWRQCPTAKASIMVVTLRPYVPQEVRPDHIVTTERITPSCKPLRHPLLTCLLNFTLLSRVVGGGATNVKRCVTLNMQMTRSFPCFHLFLQCFHVWIHIVCVIAFPFYPSYQLCSMLLPHLLSLVRVEHHFSLTITYMYSHVDSKSLL